jgi:hypothetical protein
VVRHCFRGSVAWFFGPVPPNRAARTNNRLLGSMLRKATMVYLPIPRKLSLSAFWLAALALSANDSAHSGPPSPQLLSSSARVMVRKAR